ncbi:MAG: hypothetical protein ABEI58_04040 [Candidatus Nanohaloarchaea archaeon]
MGAFAQIVESMAGMDVFQLFFPWLLVLAVSYGLLEKYNVVSGDSGVNGVVALALSFVTIGGIHVFAPAGIFASFGAAIAFSMFGLLGYLLLLGISGYDIGAGFEDGDLPVIGALVLAVLSFLGAFAFQADVGALLGGVENTFQNVVMPIMTLVFLLIVVSMTVGGD